MRKDEWLKLYATDYEVDEKTGKKKAVSRYIGPWYTVDAKQRRICALRLWIGLALGVAAFLTAGLLPTWASLTMYVTPWYIACMLPLFYLLLGTVKITRMKEKITEVEKAEGLTYARNASLGLIILGGAWLIADGIFLLKGSTVMTMTYELIFLGCSAVMVVLGIGMYLAAGKLKPVRVEEAEKTL